jgi:hypothetical protein
LAEGPCPYAIIERTRRQDDKQRLHQEVRGHGASGLRDLQLTGSCDSLRIGNLKRFDHGGEARQSVCERDRRADPPGDPSSIAGDLLHAGDEEMGLRPKERDDLAMLLEAAGPERQFAKHPLVRPR